MTETQHLSFRDPLFLQQPLTTDNVMEYFSLSPFYDKSCVNEQIKMQARFTSLQLETLSTDRSRMVGVEYELWFAKIEDGLFVIKKNERYSYQDVLTSDIYYVVDGTIFEAPPLTSLISKRIMTSLYFCQEALKYGQENVEFNVATGYTWRDQSLNQLDTNTSDDMDIEDSSNDTASLAQSMHLADFHRSIQSMIAKLQ